MENYKIGQILTSDHDVEMELGLSGKKVIIPKGNKVIIGADKLGHHIRDGRFQPLQEDAIVEGYDTTGLAEYLYICLRNHLPLDEMMENYDLIKQDIVDSIEEALDEIF